MAASNYLKTLKNQHKNTLDQNRINNFSHWCRFLSLWMIKKTK